MNRIWRNTEKGDDKIIAIGNNMIYKANPKEDKVDAYFEKIQENNIPNDVLGIPFSYIKSIHYIEGKDYIQVFFGQESEEHLRIKDTNKRNEILKCFKETIPQSNYRLERYSAFKAAKKPLIAIFILLLLFAWPLYIAIQIAFGYEYELIGNGRSVSAIILILANLGVTRVVLIFGSLIGVGVLSTIKKIKNKPVLHEIYIARKN